MIGAVLAHDLALIYGWLYAQGIWKAVVAVLVAAVLGWILRLGKRLKRIESHLDTEKPGGLTPILHMLESIRDQASSIQLDEALGPDE